MKPREAAQPGLPGGPEIGFRRITRADYPRLRRWLAQPHVAAIWGPPDDEIALMEAEIDGGDCAMHLVTLDGSPAGYVQDWCPHLAGVPHMADAPKGSRAVDTFLGDAAWLGRGAASAWMAAYARQLVEGGAPEVWTDPRPGNPRGIAMYRRAGFRPVLPDQAATRICETGAPVLVLRYRPE